jgi:hypothetical protein
MTSKEIECGLDTPVFVTVDESGHPLSGTSLSATPSRKPFCPTAVMNGLSIGSLFGR